MRPIRPMLATPGIHVPRGEEWVHEVKWDGIRLLAYCPGPGDDDGVRLFTRNGNDATIAWPEVAAAAPRRDLVLDGEVIALNDAGLPDFRMLGERMHVRDPRAAARYARERPATYMVFDVLRVDDRDLTGLSWTERHAVLAGLELGGWQRPEAYDDGQMLLDATRDQGLEGIVSKRRSSRYHPGQRSKEWQKFAHRFRGSYLVGGWRPQVGSSDRLAAVLVGEPTAGGLAYRGRVGSGIGDRESRLLRGSLTEIARSPFADEVPKQDSLGTHWVEPTVVVDVETHRLHSGYQRLRQPAFVAVRSDVSAEDLR